MVGRFYYFVTHRYYYYIYYYRILLSFLSRFQKGREHYYSVSPPDDVYDRRRRGGVVFNDIIAVIVHLHRSTVIGSFYVSSARQMNSWAARLTRVCENARNSRALPCTIKTTTGLSTTGAIVNSRVNGARIKAKTRYQYGTRCLVHWTQLNGRYPKTAGEGPTGVRWSG